MRKYDNIKEKLEPLRRFCVPGLYSVRYLSILVQRKRLRAKKIGRNYFTCQHWFEEYLEKYATEEKRAIYFNHLAEQRAKHARLIKQFKNTPLEKLTYSELDYINNKRVRGKANFFIGKLLSAKNIAIGLAIFVLFFGAYQLLTAIDDKQGQVAGKNAVNIEVINNASSSRAVKFVQ